MCIHAYIWLKMMVNLNLGKPYMDPIGVDMLQNY